ncbi:hypothetical protein [Paraburkholderia antibiotica]|uniref:Uncharacterized protein n=1 Tax=Paraburkholderia antibiotica TaxID=2728839 RepID=A0A7Y0A115_9BURK|nr:hypothetical protein [Paraburkholderia antibiotica]NML34511.1 hypothetical protein [Paraburkholderia antibiotica]
MPAIKIARFGGVVPRYDATLLKENMAADAADCKLWHGIIEPFRRPLVVEDAGRYVRTMHRFGCCWLTWSDPCIDVAEWLPTCERVYVTGASEYPLVAAMPDDGCTMDWRRVGLPLPDTAPVATALDAGPTTNEAATTEPGYALSSRVYLYTYVDSFGQEGAPSWTSNTLLDVYEGGVVQVDIPAPPDGWDIAGIRLYRLAEGFNDGTKPAAQTPTAWLFVADLDPVAQSYTDAAMTDALGEALVSMQYTPPPFGLENITQLENGVLAGSVGNQVWFCEPYQPQAWPIDYMLALDDKVRAMKWQGGVLYALTDGHPYAISEDCPDGQCCRKVYRFPKPAPIVSRKSAVQVGAGVTYASSTGLMMLAGNRMSLMTGPWWSTDDWRALVPGTMIGATVEGQYIGVTCAGAFLFDMRESGDNDGIPDNDLMPLTLTPNALHTARDGKLYLAFGNFIHEWDAGAEFMPFRWRSKTTSAPGQMGFAAAKVTLAEYPPGRIAVDGVNFRFFADERAVFRRDVKRTQPFRLPSNHRKLDFAVEVCGTDAVREIKFATSMRELSGGAGTGSSSAGADAFLRSLSADNP